MWLAYLASGVPGTALWLLATSNISPTARQPATSSPTFWGRSELYTAIGADSEGDLWVRWPSRLVTSYAQRVSASDRPERTARGPYDAYAGPHTRSSVSARALAGPSAEPRRTLALIKQRQGGPSGSEPSRLLHGLTC